MNELVSSDFAVSTCTARQDKQNTVSFQFLAPFLFIYHGPKKSTAQFEKRGTCSKDDQIGTSHHIVSDACSSCKCFRNNRCTCTILIPYISKRDYSRRHIKDYGDFTNVTLTGPSSSQEDKRCLSILSDGTLFKEGHYKMPLPFRDTEPLFPDSKSVALNRLNSFKKRLLMTAVFARTTLNLCRVS